MKQEGWIEYEPPSVEDLGSLAEITGGNPGNSHPDDGGAAGMKSL